MSDKVAAAIYERHYALRPVSGLPVSWERCPESEREHWRRVAEAVSDGPA